MSYEESAQAVRDRHAAIMEAERAGISLSTPVVSRSAGRVTARMQQRLDALEAENHNLRLQIEALLLKPEPRRPILALIRKAGAAS